MGERGLGVGAEHEVFKLDLEVIGFLFRQLLLLADIGIFLVQ